MPRPVDIGSISLGQGCPLVAILGPCVIEGRDATLRLADELQSRCVAVGLPLVFKASFDKANRTRSESYRGPGLDAGLEVLAEVARCTGLPVTTDVHHPGQAAAVAQVVDLLQVPAFLCRQTDLLLACGATGKPVNIKKGQFMAPWDMAHAVAKVRAGGAGGVLVTERGTCFGYNDLVADLRNLDELAELGVPVVFDATHSVQKPGGEGGRSGGTRHHAPGLARAAVAMGVDALFAEVHEEPERALSDAAVQLPLAWVEQMVRDWTAIERAVGR